MKRTNLIISTVFAVIVLSATSIFGQAKPADKKPMAPMAPMTPKEPMAPMDMSAMHKDGHHSMMMAYHQNVAAFARALVEMSAGGKVENVDLARAALAEIKHSIEKAEAIHSTHMSMGKMDAASMEKMKPMMDKMEADKAEVKAHVQALDAALQAAAPDAAAVNMHATQLLQKVEMMMPPDKKMDM
ncbi:MAG: hypothetical protein ABI791_05650 [Acidobacteriota bacterium]